MVLLACAIVQGGQMYVVIQTEWLLSIVEGLSRSRENEEEREIGLFLTHQEQ